MGKLAIAMAGALVLVSVALPRKRRPKAPVR
jgi:hypothetical protein